MKTLRRPSQLIGIILLILGNHAALQAPPQQMYAESGPTAPLAAVTLTAVADSYIDSTAPTTNYGSATTLYVGALASNHVGRALAWFDLSPLKGSNIQTASLQFFRTSGSVTPVNLDLSVYRIDSFWSEAGVNWANQPAAVSINKVNPVGQSNLYYSWDVTSLVQEWVDGDQPNYGVMLRSFSEVTLGWRGFASRELGANPPRLVVNYIPGASAGDAQAQGLFRLQSNSSTPLRARFRNGIPAYIHASVPTGGLTGDPLSQSRSFLNAYKDLFRLTDPVSQLQATRLLTDTNQSHIYLQQIYDGIPVFGAELGIHLSGANFKSSNGAYLPDLDLLTQPMVRAATAEGLALAHAQAEFPGAALQTAGRTGLVIFDRSLWSNRVVPNPKLAWQVNVQGPLAWMYFVDAQNGLILHRLSQTPTSLDMEIFTGNNDWSGWPCWNFPDDPSTLWFTEDGREVPPGDIDADGWAANSITPQIYNFWRGDPFSRRSYDNEDSQIEVVVNVDHVTQLGSANSVWRGCDLMELSPGWAVADIMGHEFTHGVVHDEYDPEYEDESGAVDESLSDTFGEFFENYLSGTADWLVGVDIAGRANPLRSMSNPPAPPFGDPDRLSLYFVTDTDYGGVHTNSGIANKAAWLISNGAVVTFNDIQVSGLSIAESQSIFYRAVSRHLAGNAGYFSLREAMIESAEDLFGPASSQVCTVRNAYAAVEVGDPDINCDGVESGDDPDDDSDRVNNSVDNCPTIPNPGQSDVDGDGYGDACDADSDGDRILDVTDNCDLIQNPSQMDSNHNGIGDACEDPDNDGIYNRHPDDTLWDNCPLVSNHDQADYDGDLIGDACDLDSDNDGILDDGDLSGTRGDNYCIGGDTTYCDDNAPFSSNPAQIDADSDGVGDVVDNCLGTANPYAAGIYPPVQADTDGDGHGDACDGDIDNDGILNQDDNCVYTPNPEQIDLDRNEIGLSCDLDEAFMLSSDAQLATLFFRFNDMKPLVVPIFPCWGGGCPDEDSMFPESQRAFISLQMPTGFGVRISDENGALVKRAQRGSVNPLLVFEVNPSYRAAFPFMAYQSASYASVAADAAGAAQKPTYFLEIWPTNPTQLGSTYSVQFDLTIATLTNSIYLPLVRR